jgi:hypothetical protein
MKCTEQPVTRRHIVSDESYSQIHNLLHYASSSEFATHTHTKRSLQVFRVEHCMGFPTLPKCYMLKLSILLDLADLITFGDQYKVRESYCGGS